MMADIESKFIVFTTNRSGSVWLMSTLNSLEHVTAQGELFLPRNRCAERRWDSDFAYPRFTESKSDGFSIRPFSVFSYLDNFYRIPGSVGFKLMYRQLMLYPEILIYLIWQRIRVVHLVRNNHIDVLVSFSMKAKLGQAHILAGQSAPEPDSIRVVLDTENLIQQMEWLEKKQNIARRLLRWSGLSQMEIAYEDLLGDQANFRSIWRFLFINPMEPIPESYLVKIRRGDHQKVTINYDEVKEVLANSKFANLLDWPGLLE